MGGGRSQKNPLLHRYGTARCARARLDREQSPCWRLFCLAAEPDERGALGAVRTRVSTVPDGGIVERGLRAARGACEPPLIQLKRARRMALSAESPALLVRLIREYIIRMCLSDPIA